MKGTANPSGSPSRVKNMDTLSINSIVKLSVRCIAQMTFQKFKILLGSFVQNVHFLSFSEFIKLNKQSSVSR